MKNIFWSLLAALFVMSPAKADGTDGPATVEITGVIKLGDEVHFKDVTGFTEWYDELTGSKKVPTIYFNGNPLQDVAVFKYDPEKKIYSFTMARSLMSENEKLWDSVRKRKPAAGVKPKFNQRRVLLGFGDADGPSEAVKAQIVSIELVAGVFVASWSVFFALVVGVLWWLGRSSDILKEPSSPNSPLRRYSLSRFQMAWWFVTVALSFVFVWLITGSLAAFNSDVLLLMGISSATYLSSVAIGTKPGEDAMQAALTHQDVGTRMNAENVDIRAAVKAEIKAARKKSSDCKIQFEKVKAEAATDATETVKLAEARQDLNAANSRLADLRAIPIGFFREILSDSTGIKLHRFQILIWTLIFSSIFVTQVIQGLVLPKLGATFLGLMGISSGTYIGFKFPEVKDNE